ncbi:MAG: hypothetical protein QGG26_13935 [Candidatus Undinarchaeales archaeon]|nr:hypothetical protein [Candidatus Undinarchaeales archaeon]
MGTNTVRLQSTLKGVLVVVLCAAALTDLLSGDEWVPQEDRVLRSFMGSNIQVISAYSCDSDCTSAAAGIASNCTEKAMPTPTAAYRSSRPTGSRSCRSSGVSMSSST